MTAVYSILHMLVDGICALAMLGNFVNAKEGQFYFLLYNFCAFALQMPLGVLQDLLHLWYKEKEEQFCFVFAMIGIAFTILGAVTHPVILGIGNAFFHVGGGVGTIREDELKGWMGRGLGVFVAPGALGLYLGTILAKKGIWSVGFGLASIIAIIFAVKAGILHKKTQPIYKVSKKTETKLKLKKGCFILGLSCFWVVILRSYIGMAVTFSWKQIPILGLISVLAVVCGKAAGGFFTAKLGYKKTVIITLTIATLGYLGSEMAPFGIVALFVFNMTMPMTLYLLIRALPRLPGFSFGLLTFGLFLGFLPTYFGLPNVLSGQLLGCLGSILSMVILLIGIYQGGRYGSVSD